MDWRRSRSRRACWKAVAEYYAPTDLSTTLPWIHADDLHSLANDGNSGWLALRSDRLHPVTRAAPKELVWM